MRFCPIRRSDLLGVNSVAIFCPSFYDIYISVRVFEYLSELIGYGSDQKNSEGFPPINLIWNMGLNFLIQQQFDWCYLFAFNTRAGSPGLSKGCDSAVRGEAESQPMGRVGRARAYLFWFIPFYDNESKVEITQSLK